MLEKRFYAVAPQLFTADGTTNGVITVAANACNLFKVKQKVYISATGLPNLFLEIKEIDSEENIQVGPIAGSLTAPGNNSGINARTDISAYTVALGANIFADEQKRPSIDNSEIIRATYQEEPTVAQRTIMVDECGDVIDANNPFPVSIDSEISIGDVSIVEGGNTMTVNPDGSTNVNLESLSAFQTSQYTVGVSAVHITPVPMPDRSSIGFKAIISTSTDAIYIGNSAAVTISTGYPLFNHDTLEMDLEGSETIYAICTAAGQTLCVVELGD